MNLLVTYKELAFKVSSGKTEPLSTLKRLIIKMFIKRIKTLRI